MVKNMRMFKGDLVAILATVTAGALAGIAVGNLIVIAREHFDGKDIESKTYVFTENSSGCEVRLKEGAGFPIDELIADGEASVTYDPKVVEVTSDMELGAGYQISPGLVLTAAHLSTTGQLSEKLEIVSAAGSGAWEKLQGKLVAYDPSLDLALIKLLQRSDKNLVFSTEFRTRVQPHERAVVRTNDPIYRTNRKNPGKHPEALNVNVVASGFNELLYRSDFTITLGMSGSPVTDLDGKVLGILTGSTTSTSVNAELRDLAAFGWYSGDANARSVPEWTAFVKGENPDAAFFVGVQDSSRIVNFLREYCGEKEKTQKGVKVNPPHDPITRFPGNSRKREFYAKYGYSR